MKTKFFVDRKSFCGRAAMTAMVLAILFRLAGSIGSWKDPVYVRFGILLPICACALVALSIYFFGKRAIWTSAAGAVAGGAFFVFRLIKEQADAFAIHMDGHFTSDPTMTRFWTAVFIAIYVIITVIYVLTVVHVIKTKWGAVALFAIPFGVHLYYDYRTIVDNASITPLGMMNELGVLAMLCGMFFASLGLKKAYKMLAEKPESTKETKTDEKIPAVAETPATVEIKPDEEPKEETHATIDVQAASAEADPEPKVESKPEPKEYKESGKVSSEDEAVWGKAESEPEIPQTASAEEIRPEYTDAEELLDSLPSSGPLTLDPIVPARPESTEELSAEEKETVCADDIPQGGDEPERLDAAVPQKKGLAKLFR